MIFRTETDLSNLAKKILKEKLESFSFENERIVVKTTSLTMEGEVSVNTRKQKTFLFYEMDVTLKWEGKSWIENAHFKSNIYFL